MDINLFNLLPDELIDKIWTNIDPTVKLVLNKANFCKYHNVLYDEMTYHDKITYQDCMIKNDDGFIFDRVLLEYGKYWISMKHVYFNNILYANYIYYLYNLMHEYDAKKCSIIMKRYIDTEGMCKNQYKKFRTNNIRWNN